MKKMLLLLIASAIVGVVMMGSSAYAYTIHYETCNGNQVPLGWTFNPVKVCVKWADFQNSCRRALETAVRNWNKSFSDNCNGKGIFQLQDSSNGNCNDVSPTPNIIIIRNSSITDPENWIGYYTCCSAYSQAKWNTNGNKVAIRDDFNCNIASSNTSIRKLAEHALGHGFGLDNTVNSSTRMYETVLEGPTALSTDDINGMKASITYNRVCSTGSVCGTGSSGVAIPISRPPRGDLVFGVILALVFVALVSLSFAQSHSARSAKAEKAEEEL